ncbi:glutamate--tRNA ligase [Aminobacterium colombiense]|jgi:glutamyl-tRNA synthetase|uniref:Glutamate--tRNA ligase n=1 Tax=Aminobacterium colombiense (strain DSM 12261 / ALA-1) TaxID=572547 RepID=D5EFQ0_AMICL|nr:glutamate--tRNA ligase [Aminobacterium colombiense]ADE57382.1 glutamyl-tRNA synthetase [Aminobacterium colombiense DSM 12261]MDD2379638.1 glutamate--tRNA ligase [Aminobacterium colombiense]MDD3768182.1 glutamate--tRNA ligase [Aminobacterium colombiense]MDD4265485.1 glutamate--tRNA ligase [Aminobacterium colombiense]MDD4585528.1 glutamate--tRNA ligase [Aminobacterium colombiense]
MNKEARVRFAPSPTGALHIGGGHTALFNWLWARHTGGKFILRIEDTDRERSTKEYEETIMAGMTWMGLDWDEGPDIGGPYGPYRQSERLEIYHKYAQQLLDEGKAYTEGPAIIYKVPEGISLAFDDIVYGRIEVRSETLKDIVMIKSDGMPTYNYAVVIDDYTMGINYVIRGEDHISNTPKQLLIYKALGWEEPQFAHLPMILGKDKKKLSKRHGATSVYEYRDLGYMPDSVFNFLAILGWSPGDDREVFSREEAIKLFDLKRVTKRAAVFDMDKLNFINQEHLKELDPMVRLEMVEPFWKEAMLPVEKHSREYLAQALELMGGRGRTTKELAEYSDYFVSFEPVKNRYDGSDVSEEDKGILKNFFGDLLKLDSWKAESMEEFARSWSNEKDVKMKNLAMPLRWALTGVKVSPGIFEVAEHLGRDEVKERLAYYGFVNP